MGEWGDSARTSRNLHLLLLNQALEQRRVEVHRRACTHAAKGHATRTVPSKASDAADTDTADTAATSAATDPAACAADHATACSADAAVAYAQKASGRREEARKEVAGGREGAEGRVAAR